MDTASTGTLTSSSQDSPASWWMAMMIPPTHMMGAVTSVVAVICTSTWICWTSLVVLVSSDGAPNRAVSRAEKVVTWWNIAERRSRPNPMPVRDPKYTAPIAHSTCRPVTASITIPSCAIRPVSPLATPSSMIAALTVGRYSEARVLMVCSVITAATSHRYGRTYCRSSARSMPLLSHTTGAVLQTDFAAPCRRRTGRVATYGQVSGPIGGWPLRRPLQCML